MNDYRILVVDDEEDLCEILKFNLENEGYEVDTANSAEEAMKMDISSYHLILLDVMMGEISGFKMANMLKKDKKTARVPIIFITAKDTENSSRRAKPSRQKATTGKSPHPFQPPRERKHSCRACINKVPMKSSLPRPFRVKQ